MYGQRPEKAIREQKLELERLLSEKMLDREPMDKVDVASHLAQAIVGMRRSGKSVVCRTAMRNSGVAYGYVDFDDEVLAKIDVSELDDVLHAVYEVYGSVDHFLFDETCGAHSQREALCFRSGVHIVFHGRAWFGRRTGLAA